MEERKERWRERKERGGRVEKGEGERQERQEWCNNVTCIYTTGVHVGGIS